MRASGLRRTPVDAVERGHGISTSPLKRQDMNAAPKIDPVAVHSDSDAVHWLSMQSPSADWCGRPEPALKHL